MLANRSPRYVIVIPLLWSAISFLAAISLGVKEDVSLFIACLIGMGAIVLKRAKADPKTDAGVPVLFEDLLSKSLYRNKKFSASCDLTVSNQGPVSKDFMGLNPTLRSVFRIFFSLFCYLQLGNIFNCRKK